MNKNTIHIVYALNDNFAELTAVSIRSIMANSNRTLTFHVFHSELSRSNAEKLKLTAKDRENTQLFLHSIDLDTSRFIESENVSKEVYVGALLSELLPETERAIWMDGDTVIEGDIAELWDIDLGDFSAAMVPDYSMELIPDKKRALCIEEYVYFNTGVALFDLVSLRNLGIVSEIGENVAKLHGQVLACGLNWYPSQDVLNFVLRGRVKKLPFRFNSYFWVSLPLEESIDNCVDALLKPIVVHYIGNPKPSKLGRATVNSPDWERYYRYKSMTPYANNNDSFKIQSYQKCENNCFQSLIYHINHISTYAAYFAPRLFMLAAKKTSINGSDKKIAVWGLNSHTWIMVAFLASKGLTVHTVVDGLLFNQGTNVFNTVVAAPETLQNGADEYFVLLDMRNDVVAEAVTNKLRDWNYTDDSHYFVYEPICKLS